LLKEEWAGYLDYKYLKYVLEKKAIKLGFTFSNKAVKTRIKNIELEIPVNKQGEYDLMKQQEIAEEYERLEHIRRQLSESWEEVLGVEIDFQARGKV